MKARRLIAYILFGLALVATIGLGIANADGAVKAFGAIVFVVFFLGMAGWVIGDF